MKTTCKPVPPKVKCVTLYADDTSSKEVGTIELPEYEKNPKAIVFNETIYINDDRYSYSRNDYHAIGLVHVATDSEFKPAEVEAVDEPIAPPSPRTVAQIDI